MTAPMAETTPKSRLEPAAWIFTDPTGCEHSGTDAAWAERFAKQNPDWPVRRLCSADAIEVLSAQVADLKNGWEHDTQCWREVEAHLRHQASVAEAKVEELTKEKDALQRVATDRRYMLDAYRNMLGETGLEVAQMWGEKHVLRVHFSWGPDAAAMTGEQRAQVILDMEAAPKTRVESFGEPTAARALSNEVSK